MSGTAIWYHSGSPPVPIRWVLVRDPAGLRKPQAFLCTDLAAAPQTILGWYVHRWSIETTFEETREHLGVETQRQWSDLAIARTTPALLGLFSLVTLWAAEAKIVAALHPRSAAWYIKDEMTFSDATRFGSTRAVGPAEFTDIPAQPGKCENSRRPVAKTPRSGLLHYLKCAKSS